MLKDPEEGWLNPDFDGNAECELDIDGLLKLLMANYREAHREFDFSSELTEGVKLVYNNVPEYLCGTYRITNYYSQNPAYFFEQWSL